MRFLLIACIVCSSCGVDLTCIQEDAGGPVSPCEQVLEHLDSLSCLGADMRDNCDQWFGEAQGMGGNCPTRFDVWMDCLLTIKDIEHCGICNMKETDFFGCHN